MAEAANDKKPVFLISPTERLSFTVGDSTFYYKRLTPTRHTELRAAHTERGLFDEQARRNFLVEVASECLLGWDNVLDGQMQPVLFLVEVIRYLPWAVLQRLDDVVMQESPEELVSRFFALSTNGSRSSAQADSP